MIVISGILSYSKTCFPHITTIKGDMIFKPLSTKSKYKEINLIKCDAAKVLAKGYNVVFQLNKLAVNFQVLIGLYLLSCTMHRLSQWFG